MRPGNSANRPTASTNLILTGFMGTGKTAVGRELARRLGTEFVDMDALIEAREGLSVADIFQQRGEAHFREAEAHLSRELAARFGLVIATGGGALLPEENYEILSASGQVVCLSASPEEISRRLEACKDRPLLTASHRQERIARLLSERADAYERIPLQIDTTHFSVDQVASEVLSQVDTPLFGTIPVLHPTGEYAIHLGYDLLPQAGSQMHALGLAGQIALVTNPTVAALYAEPAVQGLEEAGYRVATCMVPDGEVFKTLDSVRMLYDSFIEAGLDRRGVVAALGGGVVGDMAGFAAATYLRGIPFVQLPTSLLSMVDSSVGGKVAVDHPRGKNLIGAFKQPELVLMDTNALSSLPPRELACGLAEVVKTGLIGDPDLFEQIETHGPAPLPWLIARSVAVKIEVVEEDPYEHGRRAVLNLGHTFGHALELLSSYALSHGEGVGIGLVAAARLSARLGFCDPNLVPRIEVLLTRLGLPIRYSRHSTGQVWRAMAADKKRRGRTLRFVLLRDVGDVFVTDAVDKSDVLAVLDDLRGG